MEAKLSKLIDTPASIPVDTSAIEELRRQWPAFVYPLIIELRHPHSELSEEKTAEIIQKIALSIPDPGRLRILLDPEGTGKFDRFYPASSVETTPTTDDTISQFLATYGHSDPAEDELLNRLIFNPVPADYALSLETAEPVDATPTEQDTLIDTYINNHPEDTPPAATQPSREPEEPSHPSQPMQQGDLLSQSLAKIFIKQGHYRQAYEIIRSLSLNYPEKSIYFADQLRFLRKLILIREAAERNNKKK